MVIFFFLVGLEIKRELLIGELSSPQKALLPFLAALGGMIFPAFLYYLINPQIETRRGWGIPMATDIAFALGVLKLFGKRVPNSLKIFLMALAIIDDLGSILVLAIFYTKSLSWPHLQYAGILCLILFLVNRSNTFKVWIYLLFGYMLWLSLNQSGIHSTLAGVITGMSIPTHPKLFHHLQKKVQPWSSFLVMPLFALANSGVSFWSKGTEFSSVYWGTFLGLMIGKPLGIMIFAYFSVILKWTRLPRGVSWKQVYGISCLGGIGFTMSFFISTLTFNHGQWLIDAKIGILTASTLSGLLGWLIFRMV